MENDKDKKLKDLTPEKDAKGGLKGTVDVSKPEDLTASSITSPLPPQAVPPESTKPTFSTSK